MSKSDKAKTIKLKDYDKLIRVLRNHDYHAGHHIEFCYNKHDGLCELLKHRVVLEYINKNFK